MGTHDEAKLDTKFVEFARQMNLYLNHFPKHERYGLAQQIRAKAFAKSAGRRLSSRHRVVLDRQGDVQK